MNYFKDNNYNSNSGDRNNSSKGHTSDYVNQGQSSNRAIVAAKDEKSKNVGGLLFVLRKSEKLTTALYMVTDIMPEREPMKWKMRESSVDLLSDVTTALDGTMGERITLLGTTIRKVEKLVSFLDIAQASRMVSEMNASVLKKEYLNLKSAIEGEWEKLFDRSKSIFTDSFFDVPEDYESTFPQIENFSSKEKGQSYNPENERHNQESQVSRVERNTESQKEMPRQTVAKESTSVKPNVRLGGNTTHAAIYPLPVKVHADPMNVAPKIEIHTERLTEPKKETEHIVPPHRDTDLLVRRNESEVGKGDRRTIILALIKQKPQLAVKDITKSIPAVSEKTIQRELLAMVSEGILLKKGERRWSTYSLRSS